jgi:putative flippase GtrA
MVLLKEVFQVHYLVAATVGFIVGLTYTYLLSINWIFDERRLKNKWNELLIFTIIGIFGIGLTLFFMKFFTDILLSHYVLSKVLTTIIVSLWNFAAKKLLLFTKK